MSPARWPRLAIGVACCPYSMSLSPLLEAYRKTMANPVGRPKGSGILYNEEMVHRAVLGAQAGLTDFEIARMLGVSVETFHKWKVDHPNFLTALKEGKEPADTRVKRSLFSRATGYSYDAVKFHVIDGQVVETPYVEHVPPDSVACIFWMKNRCPDEWKDRREQDNTGTVTLNVTGGLPKDV